MPYCASGKRVQQRRQHVVTAVLIFKIAIKDQGRRRGIGRKVQQVGGLLKDWASYSTRVPLFMIAIHSAHFLGERPEQPAKAIRRHYGPCPYQQGRN